MNIFGKSFEQINFEDITSLIQNKVTEDQNLEYKREVWGRNDEGVREMLRDIGSMANAYGGFIILGMEEEDNGSARTIKSVVDAESEKDRIFQSCIANIQPRLVGLDIRCLKEKDVSIILIYIPTSSRSPHLIVRGINQFWIRHGSQKSLMSVEEMRESFLKNSSITQNSENFLRERMRKVRKLIGAKPYLMLFALPLSVRENIVDVRDQRLREMLLRPPNSRRGGWNFEFNYVNVTPSLYGLKIDHADEWRGLELHRSGYLECLVDIEKHSMVGDGTIGEAEEKKSIKILSSFPLVEYPHSFFNQLKQTMDYLGYSGEILVSLTLFNIESFYLGKYSDRALFPEFHSWSEKDLEMGPVIFEYIDPEKNTQFIADRLWQAFGFEQAPLFKDGKLSIPT